jgi:hypothetical protein
MPREDVVAALEVLADHDAHGRWLDGGRTWPGLTDAVHWLVDDTGWDGHPTADDVGTVLRTADEAEAVQIVVDRLGALVDELEPTDDDARYVSHPAWAGLVEAAERALRALRVRGRTGRARN